MPFSWWVKSLKKSHSICLTDLVFAPQLRSLKYVLLPPDNSPSNPSMQTIARGQRSRRTQFLFVYSYVVQFAFMWWLTALNFTSGVPVVAGGKGIKGRWGR